jgi:hypothetical protein
VTGDDNDAMWIPPARVVSGGEDVGKTFVPVTSADVADESPPMLAGHLRALQREVRDGFESMGRALSALTRIDAKLDVVIDRQNVADARMDSIEARVTALETVRAPLPRAVAKRRKKRK